MTNFDAEIFRESSLLDRDEIKTTPDKGAQV